MDINVIITTIIMLQATIIENVYSRYCAKSFIYTLSFNPLKILLSGYYAHFAEKTKAREIEKHTSVMALLTGPGLKFTSVCPQAYAPKILFIPVYIMGSVPSGEMHNTTKPQRLQEGLEVILWPVS